jgi:glycosyltransferase involved in cell wall biosynthesis
MTSPLVSVIMTSYNTSKYIATAIESLLAQTHSNWELLIADDCSTDNTREIIATFSDVRIRVLHNTTNLHYLRTRNRLISYFRGDFVALLDSDDLYDSEKLATQVHAFLQDPELAMCGTLVKYIGGDGRDLETVDRKPGEYDAILKHIKKGSAFTGSSIIVKTSVWKEMGGYRDFFNGLGYEDYDLTSRIVEKYKAINIQRPLYFYRQYPESTSRNNVLFNPFKLNGHLLIQHFIAQREHGGVDSLDKNDIPAIIEFVVKKNEPYVLDPSLIYRELMWATLHRKMKILALKYILRAVSQSPFRWANYKALILCVLISANLIKEQ